MNPLDKPKQLILRSLEWLLIPAPTPAPEFDLSALVLHNTAAKVRALSKLRLWAHVVDVTEVQLRAAMEGPDYGPLVNLAARLVRAGRDLSDDELSTLFVFLNAYHRAHPESSRPQFG